MVAYIFTTRKGCVSSLQLLPVNLLMIDSPLQRLFTDTDMYNMELREEMEEFYSHLEKTIRVENLTIPSKKKDYDLVLDIMPTESQTILWSYYYACHKARCLFWLDNYDASSAIYGVESPAHVSESSSFTYPPLYPLIHVQSIVWRVYIGTSPIILCEAELVFLVLILF